MILVDYDACDYCGACAGTCPENVIHLLDAKLIIDNAGCTDCGICVYGCPVRALELVKAHKEGTRREVRV